MGNGYPEGLELYGCYSREEIFALFDRQTGEKKMQGVASDAVSSFLSKETKGMKRQY